MLTDDLLALQDTDSAIDQLTNRRGRLPERESAATADTALTAADRRRAAIVARDGELDESIANLEAEGARLRAQRTRLEGQLRTVTSTRQAEALQHELDALAGHQDELDDQELAHLDEQSALQAELADIDAGRPALAAAAEEAAAVLAAAEGAMDAELANLATVREDVAGRIAAGELDRYERLRVRFGGVAVARLDGARCTGCHLDLSTAELGAARATPAGEFAACPHCGRLLVP